MDDSEDIVAARSPDCNENGVPDECEATPFVKYGPTLEFHVEFDPGPFASGDFDGDGNRDLVVGSYFNESLSLVRNGGGASFALAGTFSITDVQAPWTSASLEPVDLDDDGDLDLVVGIREDVSRFSILPNDGQGVLGPPVLHRVAERGSWNTSGLFSADLDGDRHVDLIVPKDLRGWRLYFNDGSGAFPTTKDMEEVGRLFPGDLDGDGDVDFLSIGLGRFATVLLQNLGDATFEPSNPIDSDFYDSSDLAVVDFDGDNFSDVAAADYGTDRVRMFLNRRAQDFVESEWRHVTDPIRLLSGDIDGDGDMDLIAAAERENGTSGAPTAFACILNAGKSELVHAARISVRPVSSFALGDFDGKGGLDLLSSVRESRDFQIQPFECSIRGLTHCADKGSEDCNGNGYPDVCDIVRGLSIDANGNLVPDECERFFHRADPNESGVTDISDALFIFRWLFNGGEVPRCLESADVNNDGRTDVSDGIVLLRFLYLGTQRPPAPSIASEPCGRDPDPIGSPRDLGCVHYAPCGI